MKIEDIDKRRKYAKNALYKDSQEDIKTVDQMAGFLNNVAYQHDAILTDFLDPGQRGILKMLAGNDAFVQEFGGYANAEKKRVYLSEDWVDCSVNDYLVTACAIEYPAKFAHLTHSAILGSFANSGVTTTTFGDIITDGKGHWQSFIKSELVDFYQEEVKRIGHTQVKLKPIGLKDVLTAQDDSVTITIVAASLRLDTVLAEVSRQSRRHVKEAVANNLVKLNWHNVQDSNIIVKVEDVLSLRYFGRCQIMAIRTTKKGKYKVVLKLWQTKKNKRNG